MRYALYLRRDHADSLEDEGEATVVLAPPGIDDPEYVQLATVMFEDCPTCRGTRIEKIFRAGLQYNATCPKCHRVVKL